MKRGTIEHPKTKKLSRVLGICLAQAVGHLEALWHYTQKYAIQGDIGKWTDDEIAKGALWEKDVQKFMQAMIQVGWIDQDNEYRLLVHDWEDHADQSVKKTLDNKHLEFLRPTGWNDSIHMERTFPPTPGLDRLGKERKEGECEGKNFERFWEVYPKRVSRGQAEKAWKALSPNEQLIESILQAITRAKTSEMWRKESGKFIPYPATWLRAKGWLDEHLNGGSNGGAYKNKPRTSLEAFDEYSRRREEASKKAEDENIQGGNDIVVFDSSEPREGA